MAHLNHACSIELTPKSKEKKCQQLRGSMCCLHWLANLELTTEDMVVILMWQAVSESGREANNSRCLLGLQCLTEHVQYKYDLCHHLYQRLTLSLSTYALGTYIWTKMDAACIIYLIAFISASFSGFNPAPPNELELIHIYRKRKEDAVTEIAYM